MRYGLSGASLATFGDKILISGGVGVGGILKAVKRLLVYDIRTNEWQKGPSMNQVSFSFVKNKRIKKENSKDSFKIGQKMPWICGSGQPPLRCWWN